MEPPSFPAGPSGGRTLRAAPGGEATFQLPLPAGTPPFIFEWSRAGVKLGDRFTTSDDAGGVRLTVSAAKVGDSGVYTLQASNAAGKDTTRVRLEVSPEEMPTGEDPPNFLRRLQDLTVKVGTRTRFLVEIISSTECRVTWYRNERRLLEAERIALVRDGNFWCADISAVSVDDAGRWTCTAENVGGRASCSAHLNVLVPKAYKRPEFVEELRALLTEQGTVSLECKVVGVPTPVLRWFKDSCEIKAGDVFALTANAEDPTSLGTYTCEAVNCMGRAYSSSKVHVVGRASRETSARPSSGGALLDPPPIFTKELEDQFVRICEPLTISCNIVVPPWPRSVIWYNKEGKIEASERYRVLEDGVGGYLLEVPSAEWPDEGEWKCVATSAGGRVGISTCYVSMDVPKNYRKPRFMENLQAVLTEEGLVSFECKVVGFPTPVLSWFKDGQELKPGDVYQLTGTNSLGSYCCIARNCMGQASSSAELTVEDIQNQLNEEEKLQLFSKNQAPKFLQGLKSVEAKIDEPFRFTIKVAIPPEPAVVWYRDDQPVDESSRCQHGKEERGVSYLDIQNLEFMDQAEWKCVAMNDYGHSVTSCFLKLIIPRHYKKPRFLENLQAILSDEGAVNLECKVIGVPQPVLKWYKDGEELKPGDIHRIISGQDGTCCLGTYTCEAQNCMGIASSSASLLGFEDSMKSKNKKKTDEQALQRNLSLSTIHEERTSQMYDTPVGDITLDERGEISFSFDGKEVSVSLYETPDLTEEEALQIVEMYADQLSENVTEHNVVELPPLRFVKETSTSGNLLMEAIIIDVSPEYFTSPEEDLRTEADIEDISIADENGPPQLSLDPEVDGDDYLEKTIALMSEEKADFSKKVIRKKSDSQKSADDYYSLSRDQSLSDEKKDDDTQPLSESELQSFASARSSGKPKSKSSKPSMDDGQESSEITKTVLLREELQNQPVESDNTMIMNNNQQRRRSRSSRKSSSGSEQSLNKLKDNILEVKLESKDKQEIMDMNRIKSEMTNINSSLSKVTNEIQIIERDIILKSELMSSAATATKSLEIINSLLSPLSELHSITDAVGEIINEPSENIIPLLNRLPHSLEVLLKSLTIVCKCMDVENENKTLVKKTSVSIIEKCGSDLHNLITEIADVSKQYHNYENVCSSIIENVTLELINIINHSVDIVNNDQYKNAEMDSNTSEMSEEVKHLRDTQKGIYELRSSLKSLLRIVNNVDFFESSRFSKIKKCEIILNDMSIPIQDLQSALEYIETLSIIESKSNLPKYNTEIIENIMESIIQLRASFKKLSEETDKNEDENDSNQILVDIKFNIDDISIYLNDLEKKTGKFDILYNDNKFDVLQKMAQILIALENNLPLLDNIPDIKLHMSEFHKNLTKILENVIESDDSKKYLDLLDICDGINRINSSLKSIDSNTELSLVNICNTLKLIKDNIDKNIFHQYLNQSIASNIKSVLVSIESLYNIPEEMKLSSDLEIVQDLSIRKHNENKAKIALEHIDQTIAVLSSITPNETAKDLILIQTFNNICPILEDIKYNIAKVMQESGKDEKTSDLDSLSYTETIAHQICDLHKTINILNQALYECTSDQESSKIIGEYAKPLFELNTTLQIIQQDIISQYKENTSYPDFDSDIANILESLKSCVILVQEQQCIEALDDMSTLEDISAIKSVAEIVSCEALAKATVEETKYLQFSEVFLQSLSSTSVQTLQLLKNQIALLKNQEFFEDLKSLPSINDYNNVKSILCKLEAIISSTQVILESTQDIPSSLSSSVYKNMVHSLQEVAENLSIIEISNVMHFENVLDSTKQKLVLDKLVEFRNNLNESLIILESSMEFADCIIQISKNIENLRSLSENLNNYLEPMTMKYSDVQNNNYLTNLKYSVTEFLESTNFPCEIKLPHLKEVIKNLYTAVIMGKDELISFTAPTAELLAETTIVDIIHHINNTITSLVQYNFIDVSQDLDIPCSNILNADDIKIISITQVKVDIEDILEMVHLQDSLNEPMMFVKEFCEIFKNEITLLQYLIEDPRSSKRVIKLFQVFYAARNRLKNFKRAHRHNILPENVNKCLIKLFDDSEESFKHVQLLLTEVIESYSDILFDVPVTNINNIEVKLLTVLKSSDETHLHQLISKFVNIISTFRPSYENLKASVIQELYLNDISGPEILLKETEENFEFETFTTFVLNSSENIETNEQEKDFYGSILDIIRKHKDYKDAIGSGKQIILIKCISDCSEILKEKLENILKHEILQQNDGHEESSIINLVTINQFIENLSIQLQTIYEQSSLEIDKANQTLEMKSADIENTIKISENLEQISNGNKLCLNDNDLCIIIEIDRKIQTIKNILNSVKNKPIFKNVDLLRKSIEKIDNILQKILSSENIAQEKIKILKEKTESFVQHMEQYIEVIEIVEEISAIIKLDELKESTNIAKELLQSIEATEKENNSISSNVTEQRDHKVKLVQKLQKALISFQAQVFESQQEFAPTIDEDVRQQIIKVVSDLQNDLVALTGTNIYLIEDENKLSDKFVSQRDAEAEENLTFNPINEIEESNSVQSKDTISRLQESQCYAEDNEQDEKVCLTTLSEDLKIKETSQDSLLESIKEYISDKTIAIIYKISPLIHSDHINHTVKVAEQLLNYTFCEEPSSQKDISTFSVEQYELALSLYESLSIMSEIIFEQTRDTEAFVAKYEMDLVKNIVNNLRATLQSYILCSKNALQLEASLEEQDSFTIEEERKPQKMKINTNNMLACEENILSEAQIIPSIAGGSKNVVEVDTVVKKLEESSNENQKSIILPEKVIENLTALTTTRKEPFIFNKTSISEVAEISVSAENENYKLHKDILVNQLKEYICEETIQSFQKVPSMSISEYIYKTIEIARQLQTVNIMEDLDALILSKTQLNLALKLEHTMLPICEMKCNTPELNIFFESEEVQKAQSIAINLQKTLKTLITFTLSQVDEQILELDEFKVIITKDPFNYQIMIKEKMSEILFTEALAPTENVCEEASSLSIPLEENADIFFESVKNDKDIELILVDDPKLKDQVNLIAPRDDVMINLSEDLNILTTDLPPIDEENPDSLAKLSKLFEDANETIDLSSEVLSIDKSESLQNTLDEVQIVIMKLKYDCDGATKESFNEIIEDLECNVRSVQIQIKEHSPSCQLKEACVNLQMLLTHLCEIDLDNIKILPSSTLNDCSSEAEQSIELLEKATSIKSGKNLEIIISNLNNIKETMKLLRLSFVSDPETLILGGIEILQNIDNIEEKIFCLEKDIETEIDIDPVTRDSIITAVHSVYGNISNMREAVTSIQKKYLYENYGLPSRNFLHSIKNTKTISKYDNQSYWKDCAIVFRKVLNHFEDIKFYINFDKTARLPSDAAFTKIILNELSAVVSGINQLHICHLHKNVCKHAQNCLNNISQHISDIEKKTTLEVKDKIPMFKNLATNILDLTSFLMDIIEKEATQVIGSEIKQETELGDVIEETNIAKLDDSALKDITTNENKAVVDKDEDKKDENMKEKSQNLKEVNDIRIDELILEEKQSIDNGTELKVVDASDDLKVIDINNKEVNTSIEKDEENVRNTLVDETIQNKQDNIVDLNSAQTAEITKEITEEEQKSSELEDNKIQNEHEEDEDKNIKMLDRNKLEKTLIEIHENTKVKEEDQAQIVQVENIAENQIDIGQISDQQKSTQDETFIVKNKDSEVKEENQQELAQAQNTTETDSDKVNVNDEQEREDISIYKDDTSMIEIRQQLESPKEECCMEKDEDTSVKTQEQQRPPQGEISVGKDESTKEEDLRQPAQVEKSTQKENEVMKQIQPKSSQEETLFVKDSDFIIKGEDQQHLAQLEITTEKNNVDKVKITELQKSPQDEISNVKDKDTKINEADQKKPAEVRITDEKDSDEVKIKAQQPQEVKPISKADVSIIEIQDKVRSPKEESHMEKDEGSILNTQDEQKYPRDNTIITRDENTKVKEEHQEQLAQVENIAENKFLIGQISDQQKSSQDETSVVIDKDSEVKKKDQQQLAQIQKTTEMDNNKVNIQDEQEREDKSFSNDEISMIEIQQQMESPKGEDQQKPAVVRITREKDSDEVNIKAQQLQEEKPISKADVSIIELEEKVKSPKEESHMKKDEDSILNIQDEQKYLRDKTIITRDENTKVKEENQETLSQVENIAENMFDIGQISDQQKSPQHKTSVVKDTDSELKEDQQQIAQIQKTNKMDSDKVKIQDEQKREDKSIYKDDISIIEIQEPLESTKEQCCLEKDEDSKIKTQEQQKPAQDETSVKKDEDSKVTEDGQLQPAQVEKSTEKENEVIKQDQQKTSKEETLFVNEADIKAKGEDQQQLGQLEITTEMNNVDIVKIPIQQKSPQDETSVVKNKDTKINEADQQKPAEVRITGEKDSDEVKIEAEQPQQEQPISKDDVSKIDIQEELESPKEECCMEKDEHIGLKIQVQQKFAQDKTSVKKDQSTKVTEDDQQPPVQLEKSTEMENKVMKQDQQKSSQEETLFVKEAEDQQQLAQLEITTEENMVDIIQIPEQQKSPQDETSVVKYEDTEINEADQLRPAEVRIIAEKDSGKVKIQAQQPQEEKPILKDDVSIFEIEDKLKCPREECSMNMDEDNRVKIQDQQKSPQNEIFVKKDENSKIKEEDKQQSVVVEKTTQKQNLANNQDQQKSSHEETSIVKDDNTKVMKDDQQKYAQAEKITEQGYDEKIKIQDQQTHIQEEKPIMENENKKVKIDHQQRSVEVDQQSAKEEKPSTEDRERIVNVQELKSPLKEKSIEKDENSKIKKQDQQKPSQEEIPIIKYDDSKITTEDQKRGNAEKSNDKQEDSIVNIYEQQKSPHENIIVENEDIRVNVTDQEQRAKVELSKNKDDQIEIKLQGQQETPPKEKSREKDEDCKTKTLGQLSPSQEEKSIEKYKDVRVNEEDHEKCKEDSKLKLQDQQKPSDERVIGKDILDENDKIETQGQKLFLLNKKSVEKEKETDIQELQKPLQEKKSIEKGEGNDKVKIKGPQKLVPEKTNIEEDDFREMKIKDQQKQLQEVKSTEKDESSKMKIQEQQRPEQDDKSVEAVDKNNESKKQDEQISIKAHNIMDNDGNINHKIEDQQKLLQRDKSIEKDKDSKIEIIEQQQKSSQEEKIVKKDSENKIEILNEHRYKPDQEEKSKKKDDDNSTKILDQENPSQIEKPTDREVGKIKIQDEGDHKELSQVEKSIKNDSDDILKKDQQQTSRKEKSIKKDNIGKLKRKSQQKTTEEEQSTEKDKRSKIQSEQQPKLEQDEKSEAKIKDSELKKQDQQKPESSVSKDEESEIKIQYQQEHSQEEKSVKKDTDIESKIQKPHQFVNEQEETLNEVYSYNKAKISDLQKLKNVGNKTVKDEATKIKIQDEDSNENIDDLKDKISNQQIPTKKEKSIVKDENGKLEDQRQQKPQPDKAVKRIEDSKLGIEDQKISVQIDETVKKEEISKTKIQDQPMQLEESSFRKEESKLKLISKDVFSDENKDAQNQQEGTKCNEPQKLQINHNQTEYEKQIQNLDSKEELKTQNNIKVPEVKKYKRKSSNQNEIGNKEEWQINQEKKEQEISNLPSIANVEQDKNDHTIENKKQRIQQPSFMEFTKPDYDLEFSRPPNYISKTSGDMDEIVPITKTNNKILTIYKAQTLLFESQLRSSLPPHQRSSEENTQMKDTIKAVSESRSTLSEKRTGILRDVRRKPVFSTHLTDRTAVESSRVKLTCSILSTFDATITWYKNGVVLDNKQKFRSKYVEGLITLEVLNAVPSDSGEYSCTVQNEYGAITSSANLKVYPSFEASPIPPTFTRSIRDIYHVAENELVLECRIRGQPLPTITWLKNDKPIMLNEHIQAHYLADGDCRLTINSPTSDDSGKYTCKAENSMWSDQISHEVYFTGKASQVNPNVITLEKIHLSRQAIESRRPHFTNVLSDHRVVSGGTIGLQVEIRGDPTRVEWLREGRSITEIYRNAQTYVDHDIYTLALTDVTEKETGLYTCRAWSNHGNVDMNASITVVQANLIEGKPATIVSRPNKDLLISVGEDLNISFRVQGEPKPKVFLMKGMRDLTNSLRVCKMTSDDYVKFTLKRSVIADAGTYCIFARNSYGCDRAFITVVIRQRASSDSLISDWTYPMDDLAISSVDRNYKCVPDRIPSEPSAVDGGNNWVTLAWPKPDGQAKAPILAYKIESWLLGKEGGARWVELGITPRNSFDAFNLKQGEEYHFRITPRNRYGWGESVQTSVPIGIGLAGDRPEFTEILPGQLKVLLGENAVLSCSFKGKPTPEIIWMKNGHEIEEETGRVIINVDNLNTWLRINEVEIEDEGRYSCEATNIHGRSSTYARMAVITDRQIWEADAKLKRERSAGIDGEYPPQFTMRLRDRRVQATYPVRLTCQVVGNPPPTLTWFKNGEEILVDGRRVVSQDEYFHTLEIAPTTLEDGGVYEAMARNCYGAVSCRCSLVVDKGIRAYIAPEFCCGLEPLYHLSEGDELRISAVVEAYPSVGVTWYRDGVRLRPSRRAIMTLDRDGQIELALASMTRRDAGVYTCTASNEVGRASTSGKVEVVSGDTVKEKMTAPPIVISPDVPYSKEPMFIRKPRSSEAHEGDTVIIECEVIGDPKPDVYWLRDFLKPDYYRDASHFKRVGAGPAYRFEIPHAKFDYTGAYSIIAKNIHGEAKAIISLQILAKDPNTGDDAHNIRFGRVEVIPHIEKELTDLLCYDGDAVEFECRVSGNPEPDIRWLHYNEIIPDGPDFETAFDLGTARLKIKQVTADDEGTYSCEASNCLGKATSCACLVVYPPGEPNTLSQRLRRPPTLLSAASTPRSTPRTTPARSMSRTPGPDLRRLGSPTREVAPKFYTYPYNRVAEEGDTIVFQCAVKGQPPPWATWDKDGIIITPSARFSIKEKDETFKILEIEQVTIDDVGVYRITLENDYGRAEASARLEVITQKGKFYGTTRSYSVSPNKSLPYRRRTPSFSKQD